MASYTPNLNLYKKDPIADGNDFFNIKTMMNDNWDKIDEAVKAALDDIGDLQIEQVRIATGSYVGTGTYGASNPCSLTFDFVPRSIFVKLLAYAWDARNNIMMLVSPSSISEVDGRDNTVSWIQNSVSWFCTSGPMQQLNVSGKTYWYVAFG
mgnify:CR=1 FL=1